MKRIMVVLATSICVIVMMMGCGSTSSSSNGGTTTSSNETTSKADDKTLVYLSPSMDILYWQWVEDGVKQAAGEAGYKVVTYDSGNSATEQATNAQTAITNGASGIILSPVSSTSCPAVLDACEEAGIPCAIAAIGTEDGVDNYTCFASADDETSGYDAGKYLIEKASELGSKKIGVIALPMDRTNAQNKMTGLEKAVEESGAEIMQTIQCENLTVSEAVSLVNDLLTANPDITGIYCMYEQAGTGAVTALETAGQEGKIAVVSSDGSPESIALVREGKIAGIVVQEAVGQGIVATEELIKSLNGEEVVEKIVKTPEPLVTTENIDTQEIQDILKLVYPASAGSY
ncbi:MAG: substrate-binding domain-containing protein [Lachnospiraceae bacterium]